MGKNKSIVHKTLILISLISLFSCDDSGCSWQNKTHNWREQAYASQVMIEMLPNPAIIEAISDGVNGLYIYRYDPDTQDNTDSPVIAVWNMAGPIEVEIPWIGDECVITDMIGNRFVKATSGESLKQSVGPCIIYVSN